MAKELNGKFKDSSNAFSDLSVVYSDRFEPEELNAELEGLRKAMNIVSKLKRNIIKRSEIIAKEMVPDSFNMQNLSISENGYFIEVEYLCNTIKIEGLEEYEKRKPKEQEQGLKSLINHPFLQTILKKDILTKEEQREIFNLPTKKQTP